MMQEADTDANAVTAYGILPEYRQAQQLKIQRTVPAAATAATPEVELPFC